MTSDCNGPIFVIVELQIFKCTFMHLFNTAQDGCNALQPSNNSPIYSWWGGHLFQRFCSLFSESSPGRWAILQLPCCPSKQGELLENILQNLWGKWPPHPVQRFSSSHSHGFEDEDLGNSSGLWAASAATYCPRKPLQITYNNKTKHGERVDENRCTTMYPY